MSDNTQYITNGLLHKAPRLVCRDDWGSASVPDSRSPNSRYDRESGPLKVWEMEEPPPRRWVIENYVPEGVISILFGDGGILKSFVALAMAVSVALGKDFCGLATEKQSVLYLDAELGDIEFRRRAYKVARGVQLEKPPEGLFYKRLEAPLGFDATQAQVKRWLHESNAAFLIVDSLTIGSYATDQNEAHEVLRVLKALESLGRTVLAIDHVPKPQHGIVNRSTRPFGSTFKHNIARSMISIEDRGGTLRTLTQTKANFSEKASPLSLRLVVDDQTATVAAVSPEDIPVATLDCEPAIERGAEALAHFPEGVTPSDLSQELGMADKTVRNHLTNLQKEGRAAPMGNGLWAATVPDSRPDGETIGEGIGNTCSLN
jgi:AAA domain-containing protein